MPDPGGAALQRSALTVKIENTPEALPQWGIAQADVVYEEIVNGGITRLAAIFNSQAPGKIGPVRSVRPTDTQVVFPIGGIFAYSGGAQYAINSISTAPVKQIDESSAGNAMFRDPDLQAPHNLFARGPQLFAFKGTPTPPPALFSYRSANTAAVGAPVTSFVVPFPSIYPVTWTWDSATSSWDRTIFGQSERHRHRSARVAEERDRDVRELRERHRHDELLREPSGLGRGDGLQRRSRGRGHLVERIVHVRRHPVQDVVWGDDSLDARTDVGRAA